MLDPIELSEKIENKMNHMADIISKKMDRYCTFIDDVSSGYRDVFSKAIDPYSVAIKNLAAADEKMLDLTIKKTTDESVYKVARYTGFPMNYLWLLGWKYLQQRSGNLLLVHGIHFITALQGGGKSSLFYYLMELIRSETHQGSYVNADLERAHLDESSGWYIKYHKYFDLEEFFGVEMEEQEDGSKKKKLLQKKAFNTEHFKNIMIDELLSKLNHRMNTTSDYKDMFIPMMESFSRSRHQGIQRIYVSSVLDTADIQLMQMFKYIHEVQIDLDIDYFEWLKDGMFKEHIKGWYLWTYAYKRNKKKGATEKQLIKKWYLKRELPMDRFDSLNQAGIFKGMATDQIKTTTGVK